jgi:uncharacterized membrane protein
MPEPYEETVPEHVNENIQQVHELHQRSARGVRRSQRVVESLTGFLGKPRTVYALLAGVVLWVAYNHSLVATGARPLDPPPYFYLQGLVTLYAALMTTIILITQNRQNKEVERNAHLEFQVNLLSEQRTAKIIALLEELRRDLPNVKNRVDPVAEALQQTVPPTAVSSALDHTMNPQSRESEAPPTQPARRPEHDTERADRADRADRDSERPRDHLPSTGS